MAVVAIGSLAAAGTAAAGYAGYAALAYSVASTIATAYLRTPNVTEGPRLSDLSITGAAYGTTINSIYGTIRTNALTMWTSGKQEHRHKEDVGGSKGFGKKDKSITYTYTTSIAFLISRNKIKDLRKLLIDGEVCLDRSKENQSVTTSLSYSSLRVYKGDMDQDIDPVMFAKDGKKTPAYNGYAYVIFENLDLSLWDGNIPNFTFEIIGDANEDTTLNYNVIIDGPYINSAGSGYVIFDNENQKRYHIFDTVEIVDMYNNTTKNKDVIYNKRNGSPFYLGGDLIFQDSYSSEYTKGLIKMFDTDMNFKGTLDPSLFNFWDATSYSTLSLRHAIRTGLSSYVLFAVKSNYLCVMFINDIYHSNAMLNYYYSFPIIDIFRSDKSDFSYNNRNEQTENTVVFSGSNFYFRLQNGTNIDIYKFNLDSIFPIMEIAYTIPNAQITTGLSKHLFNYDSVNDCIITSYDATSGTYGRLKTLTKISLGNGAIESYNVYDKYLTNLDINPSNSPFFFNAKDSRIGIVAVKAGILNIVNVSINNMNSSDLFTANGYSFNANSLGYNPTYWNTEMQYVWGGPVSGYASSYYRVLINRLNQQSKSVYKIIQKMCVDSGMNINDIDTSDVEDIEIKGYVDSSGGDLSKTLAVLLELYDIETIKTNYMVKFKKAKRDISAVIYSDELGAQDYSEDSDFNDYFVTENVEEKTLPSSVSITYYDIDNNYQQTTQRDDNHYAIVENNVSNEYAVALTADEAKKIAQRQLDTAYISRYKYTFSLNYNHYDLEAGDVIQLIDKGFTYTMKITQVDSDAGIVKISASSYNNIVYDQYGVGSIGIPNQAPLVINAISASNLKYLDLPLLNNRDFIGPYVAVDRRSEDMKWTGAGLEQSNDGVNYIDKNAFDTDITSGNATTVLNTWTGGNVFDCYNTVNVQSDHELSSKTETQILNGENTCLIGSEIVQYLNAELVGTNIYKLSGLLRGRFQTPTNGHAVGEEFLLLETSTVQPLRLETTGINTMQYYKAISYGQNSNEVTASGYVYTGNTQKPPAISKAEFNLDGSNNWNFYLYEVLRGQQYLQPLSVPVDMDNHNFSVDILNSSGTVLRTITFTGTNFTYTSAQQIADFGSNQSIIRANIYKLNAVVGRGKVYNLVTN